MDKSLVELLGSLGLSSDDVKSLQEAFEMKLSEARDEAEIAVREELAVRFEHDKNQLVEATERLLSDVVANFGSEYEQELGKLAEARTKFEKALVENKQTHKEKLKEHIEVAGNFATKQLTKEAVALRKQQRALAESKKEIQEKFATVKQQLKEEYDARLSKVQSFVVNKLREELEEFDIDHQALIRSRAELIAEGRKKIAETQSKLIKESARKVETMVNTNLRTELAELREDIEHNKKNDFGRRIFEAFAAEFNVSHLLEGSEIRKLNQLLESKDQEAEALKQQLNEQSKKFEIESKKILVAEDRLQRAKTLNELLSPLRGEKRQIMAGMLEGVHTNKLRESFNRFLPAVVTNKEVKATETTKKPLIENERRMVSVTGDHRANRLLETNTSDNLSTEDSELAKIVSLAGISHSK